VIQRGLGRRLPGQLGAPNGYLRRGRDSQASATASDFDQSDTDVVANDDFFVDFARQDEHQVFSLQAPSRATGARNIDKLVASTQIVYTAVGATGIGKKGG
jgi:hypothetical protein